MIKFSSPEGPTLCFEETVWKRFVQYQKEGDFSLENGGILIGVLNPAENQIIITDCTEATETDKRSRYRFFRSENFHQQIMDELWESSEHSKTYLGEWHSHDENIPNPSSFDIDEWKRITRRAHNSSNLFFIVVGKDEIGIWTIKNKHINKLTAIEEVF